MAHNSAWMHQHVAQPNIEMFYREQKKDGVVGFLQQAELAYPAKPEFYGFLEHRRTREGLFRHVAQPKLNK
jgi:hypothetical protein